MVLRDAIWRAIEAAPAAIAYPALRWRSYRYDPQQQRLELEFVSGRRYRYYDVPDETWHGMRKAFSKGEFFNENIRNHFRFTRES